MLSDNIRNNRKKNNMSQDELAEKLGVSRQSISLWETGQTQPTIDNIIALANIFNISSDMLLTNSESVNISQNNTPDSKRKSKAVLLIFATIIALAVIIGAVAVILVVFSNGRHSGKPVSDSDVIDSSVFQSENVSESSIPNNTTSENSNINTSNPVDSEKNDNTVENYSVEEAPPSSPPVVEEAPPSSPPVVNEFDLFSYCKNFAIKVGTLNGDYCIYQKPATKYGGYDNEYVSLAYWGDSDRVEFCLHCPLSDIYSVNFYLTMRGGYNNKYEWASSRYFRDSGESLRFATGYIDPAVFSENYPISCDEYQGSSNGQDEFMEESRIGICDLIKCLKEFVKVEGMECSFSDFGFVNF